MKVALVYDRVNKWGGAERVLLALQELFPDAPLFTSVYHDVKAPWANKFSVKTSFLQKLPFAKSRHEMIPFLMPVAFENFSFEGYDVVISLTSEAAKGILTKPQTKHICYCLTPTRYLWSGYSEYFKRKTFRTIAAPVISYLQKWDKIASSRPDAFVAISKEVQRRIKTYYDRDAQIVYPPVDFGLSSLTMSKTSKPQKGKYFLIVSRLSKFTQYKRIDLAVQACSQLGLPLVVVGEGSWKKELESMSGPSVRFVGSVDDKDLATYYRNCKALLFPAVEDFGLTVVEAQAFGKPVIAFRGGGALETIKEGKTGIFFDKQTKESFMEALRMFEKMTFDEHVCITHAQKFSTAQFKKKFLRLVQKVI